MDQSTSRPDPSKHTQSSETATTGLTALIRGIAASGGPVPARIGRYSIVRVLGEGGMGTVYEAQQDNPNRAVALKVIRSGFLSSELLRRFGQESQVLGRLQHPGIAQVYEAGTVPDDHGQTVPFFAMEFIRGVPLTEYAQNKNLGTRERLDLVARICDAVYHAHQKGVIHRDLKPGNILVDESGQPKILDFGVARATDSDVQQSTLRTDIGQLIGTVPYMSPEQVSGDPNELDTRSDVYALGVIAYELLAGRLPYDLSKRMIHEAARIIREEEPTRLSSINRTLRGDVETIVAKALEKDKVRRYQSAESFASDIRRYLKDEPISARPASTWYQLAKFSKRNRALVGGVVASFLILLAGLGGTAWQARVAQRQRDAATFAEGETKKRADELQKVSDFQGKMLAQVDPKVAGELLAADVKARFAEALSKAGVPERERSGQVEAFAAQWNRVNATGAALALIDRTILSPAVDAINRQFKDQPVVDAALRQVLADRYRELGMLDAALPLQELALSTRRRALGEQHPETLDSMNSLGLVLHAQGKLAEAEPLLRDSLAGLRHVLGEEHPHTVAAISNLSNLLQDEGKRTEAEMFSREAMGKRQHVVAKKDSGTLVGNRGVMLQAQGKLAEAEPFVRESLEKVRRELGEEHPNTVTAISNLGTLLQRQGKLAEAEPYFREALEKFRRVLGEEHPSTLASIGNMGVLLMSQGKLREAEPYFREAVEKQRRLLGEDHTSTITAISNLAVLLQGQGKRSEAEVLFREAMEKFRCLLGEEHPSTLQLTSNLGNLLNEMGRQRDAEAYLREALEKRRRLLGEDALDTVQSINNLGAVLQAEGKLDEAEPYVRGAADKFRRLLGEEHSSTLIAISNMGSLLQAQGKLREAEPLFREALEKQRRVLGAEHPSSVASSVKLASLLEERGEHAETVKLLAPMEGAARAAFGGGDARWLAGLLMNLGEARAGLGEFAAAETKLFEARPILLKTGGEAHKDTRECTQALVDLYTAWNGAEPGKGYDAKAAEWKSKLGAMKAAEAEPGSEAKKSP